MTTEEFIQIHREEDVDRVALLASREKDIDRNYALQQIEGWQKARAKLPEISRIEGWIYPPRLSMEQCSSEATAKYKASLSAPLPQRGKGSSCGSHRWLRD